MAVNVSPKQLTEPGFVDVVADALAESGFPADRLWLEITEETLTLVNLPHLADISTLATLLAQPLHARGLLTAIEERAIPSTAVDAFRRFGRGRHAASLNFGDCLAYAAAAVAGDSLLLINGSNNPRPQIRLVKPAATDAVTPLDTIDACSDPGATKPKTASPT